MMGGREKVPAPPRYLSATPSRLPGWMQRDDPIKWTREFGAPRQSYEDNALVIRQSVEVLRSRFQQARLTMDYWPDYADQEALARLELESED